MPCQKTLIVVAGPTAIGKTDLAIRLANHFNTVVVSADSRQFFREMSIGTAKPSPAELAAARHYFIDSHTVKEPFSVGDFELEALSLVNGIFLDKDIAILVGGSGLYLDALCYGLDMIPKPAPGVREELNRQLAEDGLDSLKKELQTADPLYYETVDPSNPQRIIRALEVWRSTGKPFSAYRTAQPAPRPFKTIWIGLDTAREKLYAKINHRVDEMISNGLLAEVKSLAHLQHVNALKTVGYTELFDYLDNRSSFTDAIELIKRNTRRFAKRQLTWFRKNQEIHWFNAEQYSPIFEFLDNELKEKN